MERHESASSVTSSTSKKFNFTHVLIRETKNKRLYTIPLVNVININSRKLKINDEATFKLSLDGRNQLRGKILVFGDESVCNDQLEVIMDADELEATNKEGAKATDEFVCGRLDSIATVQTQASNQIVSKSAANKKTQSKPTQKNVTNKENHPVQSKATVQADSEGTKQKHLLKEQNKPIESCSNRTTVATASGDHRLTTTTPETTPKRVRIDTGTKQTGAQIKNNSTFSGLFLLNSPRLSHTQTPRGLFAVQPISSVCHTIIQPTLAQTLNSGASSISICKTPRTYPTGNSRSRLDSKTTETGEEDDNSEPGSDNEQEKDERLESAVYKKYKLLEKKFDRLHDSYERLKHTHSKLKQNTIPKPDEHAQKYFISIAEYLQPKKVNEEEHRRFAEILGITAARLLLCTRSSMTRSVREIVKAVVTPENVAAYKNKDDFDPEIRAAIHGFVRSYHSSEVCSDRKLNEAIRGVINNQKEKNQQKHTIAMDQDWTMDEQLPNMY